MRAFTCLHLESQFLFIALSISMEYFKKYRFKFLVINVDIISQWFSNCTSRRPGASFQFSKGVAEYFGFVPLSLGFIASKEL